jgi:hyperosmotically inducible periplasmic protein
MDSQNSRKIIVAGGMAAVVVATIFALRAHHDTLAAQPPPPPTPFTEVPAAPATAAPTPDAPPAIAQIPDAPAAARPNENVGKTSTDTPTPSAVEPKLARERHPAKADRSAAATTGNGTRAGSTADTSEKPAAETIANSADRMKSADELTTPPAASSSPADDQKVGTSAQLAASDSQITTDVKSELAGDSLSKDVNIGVTTTHGVVALTGTLASQSAIDHVKDVAGKAKDVKSVDGSALILASL